MTIPAAPDRRHGLVRVPFVRRCRLELPDGRAVSGYTVNMNIVGAYVSPDAPEDLPQVGETVRCRFAGPAGELEAYGMVSWVNDRQQHAVHSLPPGFGLRFEMPDERLQRALDGIIREYLARNPVPR
ncbi:MAG TPA: PilZ domain-containing protein [Vicinamibacteria bacterium]|jgi:hypothetical protein